MTAASIARVRRADLGRTHAPQYRPPPPYRAYRWYPKLIANGCPYASLIRRASGFATRREDCTMRNARGGSLAVLFGLLAAVAGAAAPASAAEPAMYAVDFIDSPATGSAMNDQGVVAGARSTLPPGCTPSTCAPLPRRLLPRARARSSSPTRARPASARSRSSWTTSRRPAGCSIARRVRSRTT